MPLSPLHPNLQVHGGGQPPEPAGDPAEFAPDPRILPARSAPGNGHAAGPDWPSLSDAEFEARIRHSGVTEEEKALYRRMRYGEPNRPPYRIRR